MISSGFLTYDRDATQQTCSNVIEPNPGGSTFRDGGGGEEEREASMGLERT